MNSRFRHLLSILFLFIFWMGQGQIKTKIDTTSIRIGEPIKLSLTIENSKLLKPLKDSISGFDILKVERDSLQGILNIYLTNFKEGSQYLKGVPFLKNKEDTVYSRPYFIEVYNVKVDTLKQKKYDIIGIVETQYTFKDFLKEPFLYTGIILLCLISFGIYLYKKNFLNVKKEEEVILLDPDKEALNSLIVLDNKAFIEKKQIKKYYSELDYILRRFISRNTSIEALESTAIEVIKLIRKESISQELNQSIEQFINTAHMVKFAKLKPDLSAHTRFRETVEKFIKETYIPIENELD